MWVMPMEITTQIAGPDQDHSSTGMTCYDEAPDNIDVEIAFEHTVCCCGGTVCRETSTSRLMLNNILEIVMYLNSQKLTLTKSKPQPLPDQTKQAI